uniref:F-box domain-containing protein n=1 Tax=Aegilops tauschii subsp. strangulata TaxID=200361 RepID=A0A453GI67_AEGTS
TRGYKPPVTSVLYNPTMENGSGRTRKETFDSAGVSILPKYFLLRSHRNPSKPLPPENPKTMDGDRRPTAAAALASAVAAVLGDDNLLREILLHLGFPTCLVHAALVSKRWLHHASDPAFLRRFRERNPPCLLGACVGYPGRYRFVPLPPPYAARPPPAMPPSPADARASSTAGMAASSSRSSTPADSITPSWCRFSPGSLQPSSHRSGPTVTDGCRALKQDSLRCSYPRKGAATASPW